MSSSRAEQSIAEPPVVRDRCISRRALLHRGSLFVAGGAALSTAPWALADSGDVTPALRIGLMTDVHYADKQPGGSRHYRDSLAKVREAAEAFNEAEVTLAIELGDLIDAAPEVETEIGYLQAIDAEYARFDGPRHYVLGNHCVHTLTKEEFIDNCAMESPHYSFDEGDFHFVVLDACFRSDGVAYSRRNFNHSDSNIPPDQLEWLADDLKATDKKTLVFTHQRLDPGTGGHFVKNAADVREVLEQSGRVLAVLSGHSHQNHYAESGGIHYCVLWAVVEGAGEANSGYSLIDLSADGSIRIDGFRQQEDYDWPVRQ